MATMAADDKNDSDSSESSSSSDSSNSSSSSSSTYRKNKKKADDSDDESSSERLKTKAIESMRAKKAAAATAAAQAVAAQNPEVVENFNYTFYDPETHWCRTCNVFPKTARDYLNHLHSNEHIQHEAIETPWHDIIPQDSFPIYENAESKRLPVRGLMFLSPASSWFCKLCKYWIGDLHCASVHLKSQTHFKKYNQYIAQNPNFEIEWETERVRKRNESLKTVKPVENDYTISSSKAFLPEKKRVQTSSSDSSSDSDSSGHGLNLTRMPAKVTKKVKRAPEPEEVLEADSTVAPPPPKISSFRAKSKDSDTEEDTNRNSFKKVSKLLPPIISESEKKLLVQLKGKIKPTDETESKSHKKRERSKSREVERSRSRSRSRHRRRSRTRSRSRSVSIGRNRRNRRKSRSRGRRSISRGREGGWTRPRRNYRRSRSARRRSRSPRRRRSRSVSPLRVEKPIIKHSEFRPRVQPETEKKKKDAKEKSDGLKKLNAKPPSTTTTNGNSNKKLPFIGKMPVLNKKPTTGQEAEQDKAMDANQQAAAMYGPMLRPTAPTAAQIQMAMMEDVYGNAPPFHPDAGMAMDYDDLMPDPVQYVNLMGPVPPPPPPRSGKLLEDGDADSDTDMLPPGIDPVEDVEEEQAKIEEQYVEEEEASKPPPAPPSIEPADKNVLPEDLEAALNIIFPGDKKEETTKNKKDSSETLIITDENIMQAEDLVKEGIHMMTSEDLNAMDEASQMSMNEPLIFKSRNSEAISTPKQIEPPKPMELPAESVILMPDEIPMPQISSKEESNVKKAELFDLEDIPRPPPSPTDSEKQRRQEAMDDLALLGIDADDMAAQCI